MENNKPNYPIKWEVKSHSYQIADTGDYDGYWEVTNGKDSLLTKEDYDDIEKDLQEVADLLNRVYANLTIDRGIEAALEAENKWLKSELEQLHQWKMEAVELQAPIIAYVHKHLECKVGDSCTALVIAELDRLREENAALKAQPGARWVKCSDRLPEISKPPKLLTVKRYEAIPEIYSTRAVTAAQLADIVKYDFANFEWLDEQPAAGMEEDAVIFSEWAIRNATVTSTYDGWIYGSKRYTTTELYELFKQQKK